jgi:hypothetical protein
MSAQKLTCPECSTVLRPARPVAPGKKVKCPRCETVFTAGDDDDDAHEAPTIKPTSKARAGSSREGKSSKASSSKGRDSSKPGKPAKVAAKADEKPKEETYGVVKDDEEEAESIAKKLKIDYAPDDTIKDLRGPAVARMVKPSNWLAIIGFVGFFGWLTLIVFIVIPAAFPLKPEKSEVMRIEDGLGAVNPGGFGGMMFFGGGGAGDSSKKFEEETASFFEVFGIDLWVVGQQPWYYFWPALIPFVILMFVSGLVGYGAVQMQNLESRKWGIAGCILAMLPFTTTGVQVVSIMCAQFFLGMVSDDREFIAIVGIVIASIEWLASLGVGIWALCTLMNEDVIAGFEYVAE